MLLTVQSTRSTQSSGSAPKETELPTMRQLHTRVVEAATKEEEEAPTRGGISSSKLPRWKWSRISPTIVLLQSAIVVLACLELVNAFSLLPRSTSSGGGVWGTRGKTIPTAFAPGDAMQWKPTRQGVVGNPIFRNVPVELSATRLDVDDDDEDDEDDDDEVVYESSTAGRLRKRDRIKDWFAQNAGDDSRTRIKSKFDNIFGGMPSMSEILADKRDSDDNGSGSSSSSNFEGGRKGSRKKDPAWFEEEKNRIMDSFEEMLTDMLTKLEEQRRDDPESVPENAEGIIKSVLKQEMDTEIERAREELSLRRLQEYEISERQLVDGKDISGPVDDEVQRLIDESEQEYSQKEASRLELEEFLKYEAEAFRQAAEQIESEPTVEQPQGDLDQWALNALQGMANSRQDVDGGEIVLDILDEITEDLQERMLKEEAKKGSIKTDTLKEWQMYRAIATRLKKQRGETTEGTEVDIEGIDDEQIRRILDSWKDYVAKEKKSRDEGGLSFSPTKAERSSENVPLPSDRQQRAETRKKINKMSIEALESLMVNSDPARREKLQREVDFLKGELEGKDYLDFEEPEEEAGKAVDMTGVFGSQDVETTKPRTAEERKRDQDRQTFDAAQSKNVNDYSNQLPADTQLFSDEKEYAEPTPKKAPPPNTAFFSDSEDTEEHTSVTPEDSKLGSLEEQKLASLYRRAGARTREEQDRVRSGWEDYQKTENEKRKLSGLGSDSESVYASAKFNVSDIMKEDGDFDADKILSAIGPRPKRGTKKQSTDSPRKEEVASSLYRSISAVGGDRFKDDPAGKAKDQEEFQSFLEKEIELRRSLDETSESSADEITDKNEGFDADEYAEDVLANLEPRPRPRRSTKVDPREFSDRGGILASEEDNDDDGEEDTTDSALSSIPSEESPEMPDWLRQENEEVAKKSKTRKTFLGAEVEDAFDDDQYEKNMRQLAEYERRRSGKQASMGIDITDVLGRRDVDDYKDYMFDENMYAGSRRGWGVASFEDRKRNLIDYTELDLGEVNSLMDHRDSVHSTGVSQYTKRINKPFQAFGAIFRLEGLFVDLSGMHEAAWTEVAEKEDLRVPSEDEIRRASVVQAEAAVREVFVWTDDFFDATRIARVFRESFSNVFNAWAEENGLLETKEETALSDQGSLAIGGELFEEPSPSSKSLNLPTNERDLLQLLFRVWSQVAFDHGKSVPSESQIQQAAMVTPDIAIQEVFKWTRDIKEVVTLEKEFQKVLRKLSGNGPSDEEITDQAKSRSNRKEEPKSSYMDETSLMEAHYFAWTKVAEKFDFEKPSSDEVLGAFVLNDPRIAARDGFGWTDDTETLSQVVQQFSTELNEAVRNRSGQQIQTAKPSSGASASSKTVLPESADQPTNDSGNPTFEEVLEMNKKAWKSAAASHGFKAPPEEFVKLSLNMDPVDVITKIFRWSWDGDQVARIAKTFTEQLRIESEAFATKYELNLEEAAPESTENSPKEPVANDDLYQAAFNAWTETARVHSLKLPSSEQVLMAMSVGPEEAISTGFGWTSDREAAWWIKETYMEKLQGERERLGLDDLEAQVDEIRVEEKPLVTVIPGAQKWIKSLREYEMQCGVISHLSREQVAALLKFAKLDDLFGNDVRVSSNNGYKTDSQQMLGAALRLERRPDHCVVFDSSPHASVAAHEIDMRSVGLIGSFPRYELLSADTTASGFEELTAFNIRRLFGERIFDQPQFDQQQTDPVYKKKVKTAFEWGDE